MTQNSKNQRGKNFILISHPSGKGLESQPPNFYSRNSSLGSELYNFESNLLGRQSSITGNLFKSFQTNQKHREEPTKITQQPKINDAQRYAQQCLEYQKYQFDDRIKLIIHRMAIRAYQNFKDKFQNKFLSFSIQKLLSIISKKLLLNRFQLLFLQYVFEQTKWNFDILCIAEHAPEYLSYAHSSESQSQSKVSKQLEIYFLYCSFYSKKSLNELPSDGKSTKGHKFNGLTGYLKSLCKKFNVYFQEWTQKSNVSNIKINPKILNSIFKRLTYYTDRDQQDVENYCLLVEQILDISPAYNAEKGGPKSKKNKKIKKEEEKIEEEKEEQEQIPINQDNDPHDSLEQMHPLRNRKQTSYLSNVDGFQPQKYINRRMI